MSKKELNDLITKFNTWFMLRDKLNSYLENIDNWQNGEKHELKEKDITNIEKVGIEKYVSDLLQKVEKKCDFDNVASKLVYDYKIKLTESEWKNGINENRKTYLNKFN